MSVTNYLWPGAIQPGGRVPGAIAKIAADYTDYFNRAGGVNLHGSTPSIGAAYGTWLDHAGAGTYKTALDGSTSYGGVIAYNSSGSPTLATLDAGNVNHTASFTNIKGGGSPDSIETGVVGGLVDASNFYLFYVSAIGATQLYKCVAGSFSTIGSAGTISGVTRLDRLELSVSVSGSTTTLVGKVNGVQTFNSTDSSLTTGTRVGMRLGSVAFADNFLLMVGGGSTDVTVTSAITEADNTLSSTATIPASDITATLAVTEAADTLASAATEPVTTTTGLTQANNTLSSTATEPVTVTSGITAAVDTIVATTTEPVTAALTLTQVADTLSSATTEPVTVTASALESVDTCVATTTEPVTITASITEAADTLASTITEPITVTCDLTEDPDTCSATTGTGPIATLAVTEAADTLSSTTTEPVTVTASATEAADTISATTTEPVTVTASISAAPDTCSSTTGNGAIVALTVAEAPDTISATTTEPVTAAASISEAPDTLSSSTTQPVLVTSSITESSDTLVATTMGMMVYSVDQNLRILQLIEVQKVANRSIIQTLTLTQSAQGTTGDMPNIIIRQVTDVLYINQCVAVTNGANCIYYGTIEKADNYFDCMLEGQRWVASTHERKHQALVSATKRIDRLNFFGVLHDPMQPKQFPRGTDTLVPVEVEWACYELAQALLKGVDPDTETDLITTTFQGYGGLRTEYDRSSLQPWVVAGIPCKIAWDLLWPFLDERRAILLTKVS